MADPSRIPRDELENKRDLGAVIYCGAYIELMRRELDVPMDKAGMNEMITLMVEPMNHATEAIWRALMSDHKGLEEVLERFRQSLDQLSRGRADGS